MRRPIALVILVDADRLGCKARFGIDHHEIDRDASFGADAILQPDDLFVVPDAHEDPRFVGHPFVVGSSR